jgi:hypothetical protein
MRFMIMLKADKNTEGGIMPDPRIFEEMGKFNQKLIDAGMMLAGEGLQPSAKGARVITSGGQQLVTDGPFAETKELIAGFWIWEAKSKADAIAWAKRIPNPARADMVVEVRQVFEADDFGDAFTPELRAQEERMRAQSAAQRAQKKR